MKNGLLAVVTIFILTACSGGGGGGSSAPSSSVPQVIKYPKAKCGSKDCLTGATISSLAMNDGTAHDTAKNGYSNIKTRLDDIKNFVQFINLVASEENIESCADIPTAGSLTWDVHTFTFSTGAESWNLGGGSVTMTHQVTMDNASNTTQFNFRCDNTVQSLHVITKSKVSTYHAESFSQMNSVTGETRIQVVAATNTSRDMAYFYSDGGDKFTLASFFSSSGSQSSVIAKSQETAPEVNPEQIYIETAYSLTDGIDLDTLAFGDGVNAYRGCVYNYRTSSPAYYPNSCDSNNPTTKYALMSGLSPILLGDATTWDTQALANITIMDP